MREIIKKFADKTFLRFVLVGIINTVFGTAIMFVFYNVFGLSYWLSSASNYFFGSILSYFLNKYYTFKNTERSWRQVLRFALNVAVCWLLAYGIAKPLALRLLAGFDEKLQTNAAMLAGLCLYTALNYLGQRFFAFRVKED